MSRASVSSGGKESGRIDKGLLVFLGVAVGDGDVDVDFMVRKIAGLRVFKDDEGKMNLDLKESGGSILMISQFTLLGDARRGNRPSYGEAAAPEEARKLYEACMDGLRKTGLTVSGGVFQTHMDIDCLHDGPVTILLDSRKTF